MALVNLDHAMCYLAVSGVNVLANNSMCCQNVYCVSVFLEVFAIANKMTCVFSPNMFAV